MLCLSMFMCICFLFVRGDFDKILINFGIKENTQEVNWAVESWPNWTLFPPIVSSTHHPLSPVPPSSICRRQGHCSRVQLAARTITIEYLSVSVRSCDHCKVRAICVLSMLAPW